MSEVFRGKPEEVWFIDQYLDEARHDAPLHALMFPVVTLKSLLTGDTQAERLDIATLLLSLEMWHSGVSRWNERLKLLPPERFFVGLPTLREHGSGGFLSRYGKGFQYIQNYGLSIALVASNVSAVVSSLELARNYLHDSVHSSTFRSFRRTPVSSRWPFPVYRDQYGFSFNRPDGTGYSAREFTDEVPERINLKLLMDGLTVLAVADILRSQVEVVLSSECSPDDRLVAADILARTEKLSPGSARRRFHEMVTDPSRSFLSRWPQRAPGGSTAAWFNAMMTGRFGDLANELRLSSRGRRVWTRTFMSPRWLPSREARHSSTLRPGYLIGRLDDGSAEYE